MRPLTMTLSGVRSYRTETTIDFADRSLVAVIGDTGAGKSSLLEALTYALYGGSTWSKQPGDLISHSTALMRVTLDFEADGQRWTVTRSMSATNYPAPVHHLECASTGEKLNSKSGVNARIEQLIGLDYDGFLRAVILPQGKFDKLLTATKGERDATLKNIFRVDQLEAVRDAAKALIDELNPKHSVLVLRRADLLDDPEAEVALREAELAESEEQMAKLHQVQEAVKEATARRDAASLSATRLTQIEGRLPDEAVLDGLPGRIREVAVVGDAITVDMNRVRGEREAAEERLAEVKRQLQKKADDGTDAASLAAARQVLSSLPGEYEALLETLLAHARKRVQLSEDTAALEALRGSLDQLEETAKQADLKAEECSERAAGAKSLLENAHVAITEYETAVKAATSLDARRVTAAEQFEAMQLASSTADDGEQAADKVLDEVRADLERVQRANAAAHAAHGLQGGQPCPICDRPLEEDFAPPTAEGLSAAEKRVDQAKKAQAAARATARKANAEAESAAASLATADEAATEGHARVERSLATVVQLLTEANVDVSAENLLADKNAVLAPLGSAASASQAALVEALAEQRAANDAVVGTRADRTALATAVDRQEVEIQSLAASATATVERLKQRVDTLDTRWQPKCPDLTAALDASEVELAGQLEIETAAALTALAALEKELHDLETSKDQAEADLSTARDAYDGLVERKRTEVDELASELVSPLRSLADRLVEACVELGFDSPGPVPIDLSNLEGLAGWVEQAADILADLRITISERIAVATNERTAATSDLEGALASIDVDTTDELVQVLAKSISRESQAKTDLAAARSQVPVAKALDQQIADGQAFLDNVELVRSKLQPSAFIGHLINSRQQALLGVASAILSEITNDRFGFSDDFEIFDQLSGQPRSARTLSGGETFLASLALALGMVELAARAGGRLDALFLDEGFGALDIDNLEAAVDALEARAQAGRLVVVISHVMAVAERIPDVLAVYSKNSSSQIVWLDDTQRQIAANADVDTEVSKVLAGLLR